MVMNVMEYMERMEKKGGCQHSVLARTMEATGKFYMSINMAIVMSYNPFP